MVFGPARSLVGVITDPEDSAVTDRTAVILLNSGLVHRVGPNRLYVNLARQIAAMGITALRFDLSGVGDSRARRDNLPYPECTIQETQEAMNLLAQARGCEHFVLAGICSGAVNSFDVACRDSRVVGAVMVNPLAYTDAFWDSVDDYQSLQQARRYWKGGLGNPRSWLRVLSGQANYGLLLQRLRGLLINENKVTQAASGIAGEYRTLIDRGVRLMLVYSERERRAKDPHELIFSQLDEALLSQGTVRVITLEQADHTLNTLASQQQLINLIRDFLEREEVCI